MTQIIRKGRNIQNVNNTLFFLMFREDWFLRFQAWLEIWLLPKEGTVTRSQFQKENYIPELAYLFLFSTTKSWKLQKKLLEKSAKINAESKKSVNHTNKIYYWDHLGLAAVQQDVAWRKELRNSIRTSPNKMWCEYLCFLCSHRI